MHLIFQQDSENNPADPFDKQNHTIINDTANNPEGQIVHLSIEFVDPETASSSDMVSYQGTSLIFHE